MKLTLKKPAVAKKRGRPPKGKVAMTPYERLKKHRQSKKQQAPPS